MAIYKRKGSAFWWYSVYRGANKMRVLGSTGKTDKAEAAAVENVIRMAYQGKTPVDKLYAMIDALSGAQREGVLLSGVWDAYEGWLNSTGRRLADSTERKRKSAVARFVKWALDCWPSASCAGGVDRACAAGFAVWLSKTGASGKTRRNVIGDLGTVWEGLKRVRDDVKQNPWPLVLPENDSERMPAFTREQEKLVFDAADKHGKGWGLACRIARFTGLRYGDVARLKWSDVDLEAGVIRLSPSKTTRHGIVVVVPMSPALAGAMREARVEGDEYVLPLHAQFYPRPETSGGPGPFSDVLKVAGLSGGRHTFHSWRHTFRSALSAAKVSDEIAKRLGGWTEDKTSMHYDHDGRLSELKDAVAQGERWGDCIKPRQR